MSCKKLPNNKWQLLAELLHKSQSLSKESQFYQAISFELIKEL